MRARLKSITVPLMSQFNWRKKESNTWCGRASGAMLYNYYVLVYGGSEADFIVNNRDEGRPFDILYPDGAPAAIHASGSFSPSLPLIERHPGGLGARFNVPSTVLYPKANRPPGPPSQREIDLALAPLLDYLDHNNPALFASGLSKGKTGHASHFILVTGYEYDEGGALWLEISDPSINYPIIEGQFPDERLVRRMDDGLFVAAPQAEKPSQTPRGCRYKVKAELFFRPNSHLAGKGSWDFKKYGNAPNPVLFCDNDQNFSREDGFAVLLASPVPDTPDNRWVTTELGLRMPVSVDLSTDWTRFADPAAPFPIGANRTWHSGIRVLGPVEGGASEAPAEPSVVADSRVWSIADGAVVAVRFPSEPLEEGAFSSGMVLVRHEIDPVTLAVLLPAARDGEELEAIGEARSHALPFYSLYLHLAPLSAHLDAEGKTSLARSPRWLRSVGPQALPELERFVPEDAPLRLTTWSDAAFGEPVTLPMVHLTHPPKLAYDAEGPKLGGVETAEMSLGASALVVPVLQGAAQYPAFSRLIGPSLAEPQNRCFYNPLTGQVIESSYSSIRLAAGTPLEIREAERTLFQQVGDALGTSSEDPPPVYELDVLAELDGFCYVAIADDPLPGFDVTKLPSKGAWSADASALSFDDGEEVRLSAEVGERRQSAATLSGPGHVMRFSGSAITSGTALPDEVEPDLLPCVTLTKAELSGAPIAVATERKLFYFNVLTEQLIETELDVAAETAFVLDRSRPAVVAQVGDVRYARVQGFRPVLETARAKGVMGRVLRFDSSVSSIPLYAKTTFGSGTDPATRYFPDAARMELANARFSLAFEVRDAGHSNGRDRIWPSLPSVAKLAKSEVKRIDAELKEKSPAMPILERLRKCHGALYAVELGEEHGWQLVEGRVVPTSAEDVERHLCAVVVAEGALVPQRIEGETAEHPLEVSATPGLAIQPVHVVSRDDIPRVAYFEVIESVAPDAWRTNQPEIDAVAEDNVARQALLDRLATGALEVFSEPLRLGPEWIGWMGETGAGNGVHVEVFSGMNLVDADLQGTDDTVTPVPGSTWAILRDDDPQGQFTRGFVKTMFDQVVLSPDFAFDASGLPEDAVEYELDGDPTEDEWVPSPPEWLRFCNHGAHPRQLARLIACHAVHWRRATADLLDHPDARAAHIDQAARDAIRSDIEALAFADDVVLDETSQSSIDPARPVFHYHPLRLVEWLRTGIDVDASLYASRVTASGQLTVTLDLGGATGIPIDPVPGHPCLFRFRTTIGDVTAALDATLHLEGFETATTTIRTTIERGKVRRIQLTPPRVSAAMRIAARAPALAIPVRVRAHDDLTLLADCGELPESGLGHAEVEGSAHYNVYPPERIEAVLEDASAFRFVDTGAQPPEGYDVSITTGEVVFTRRADAEDDAAPSPRAVRVSVFVAASDAVGASTAVTLRASGGDMPGTVEGTSAAVQTRELRRGKQKLGGADVVKLQLLLSQIPARDGVPCYRFCERHDYGAGGKSVLADGDYGPGLARAIWRFVDAYRADPNEAWTAEVRFLRDGTAEEASVTAGGFPTDPDTPARLDGSRRDYPIVDAPLIGEILRRFDARYVTPRALFSVAPVSADLPTTAFAAKPSVSELGTILARTAILPLDGEEIRGTLALEGLLDERYEVKLSLAPNSHYRILADGARALETTVTIERASPRRDFVLAFSGDSTEQSDCPDESLVATNAEGTVLASIGLSGVRDLTIPQSSPGRDILLLELYLSQILDTTSVRSEPCFRHRHKGRGAVVVDGVYTNELARAIERFEAGLPSSPGTYARLVELISDAYFDAIYTGGTSPSAGLEASP